MTVGDFLEYCTELTALNVDIFDCSEDEVVYQGPSDEIPGYLERKELQSFEPPSCPNHIVLNID